MPVPNRYSPKDTTLSHSVLAAVAEKRRQVLQEAARARTSPKHGSRPFTDPAALLDVIAVLEFTVLSEIYDVDDSSTGGDLTVAREAAADAAQLLPWLPVHASPLAAWQQKLWILVLAAFAKRETEVQDWLRTGIACPPPPVESQDWGERCQAVVVDSWLRILGSSDVDAQPILWHVAALRQAQPELEPGYLAAVEPAQAKRRALELIALYHLARAAETLAQADQGETRRTQTRSLETYFARALKACERANWIEWATLVRVLALVVRETA